MTSTAAGPGRFAIDNNVLHARTQTDIAHPGVPLPPCDLTTGTLPVFVTIATFGSPCHSDDLGSSTRRLKRVEFADTHATLPSLFS